MQTKTHYSFDIYRVYIENKNDLVNLEIDNVISWDTFKLTMTKEEFEKLIVFMQEKISLRRKGESV